MLCHASGFEDIHYWVQLTGLNKQKTGPNSGGIYYVTVPIFYRGSVEGGRLKNVVKARNF